MDRVQSDKDCNFVVPAYELLQSVVDNERSTGNYGNSSFELTYVERSEFYAKAKKAFCIVQTSDSTAYANVLVSKGVL